LKHFLNRELLAPNVMTFAVDESIVAEFRDLDLRDGNYSTVKPSKNWNSDIQWISAADEETFSVFQSAFDRLAIGAHAAPYLDIDRQVRLYAGFLVVRSRCTKAHLHVDWNGANNEAFTLLTPVSGNTADFGLLYKKLTGETGEYAYKTGEAIAFGDNFQHGTKPGQSEKPVVLLCFEYGTDKMEHWPRLHRTVGYQATHLRQPDGEFVRAGASSEGAPQLM
jgi:hypothetical protein